MATNPPVLSGRAFRAADRIPLSLKARRGDNQRVGAVRDHTQVHNPHNDRWVKRDSDNGRFLDQKADTKPFKGVRREK